MAKFMKTPPELTLAIASLLPRSADKLSLMLVNHQLYHSIKPELYKNIMLDQRGFASRTGVSTRTHQEILEGIVRFRELTSVPKDKPHLKPVVQSLSLELTSDMMLAFLSSAILDLPGLKHLNLSSKRWYEDKVAEDVLEIFINSVRQGLRDVKATLESLTINVDEDIWLRRGRGIGPMMHLTALKQLSIQSHILLPVRDDHLCNSEPDENFRNRTILHSFLPPMLQQLCIGGGMDGEEEDEHCWGHVTAVLLEDLVKWDLEKMPELQDITVYYPAHYAGFTMTQEDASSRSECSRYAAKGLWPEVAMRLTELASQAHRNISVRYEQG